RRLFELEVPEIFDNIIEIVSVAREPGDRTKIAVRSHDKRIDPVGACVGMKGIRIQAVVRELNGEKIDIVHWSADPEIFIKRAMSPVTPLLVVAEDGSHRATVVVPDDQIQFAIGKRGQNVRLASEITGRQIDPIKESEYLAPEALSVDEIEELDEETRVQLKAAGFEQADDALDAGLEGLMRIEGMDEERAQKILDVLNTYFETIDTSSLTPEEEAPAEAESEESGPAADDDESNEVTAKS
ncbi:transcription termination/antitermination protein NusA, partial [bacterium]